MADPKRSFETRAGKRTAPGSVRLPQRVLDAYKRERCAIAVSELVHEHGYHRLTADLLVKRAKISRTTFYALFEGRDDAFRWACEYACCQLLDPLEEAAQTQDLWDRRVEASISALVTAAVHNKLLAELSLVHSPAHLGMEVSGRGIVAEALAQVLEEGPEPPVLESQRMADLLAGGVVSVLAQRIITGRPGGIGDDFAAELTALVLRPYQHPAAA